MARTVLIDADISVFQVACSQEETFEFAGKSTQHADLERGIEEINKLFDWIIKTTDSDQAALFLTGKNNFRKEVLPTYKGNRTGPQPVIREGLRQYVASLPMSFMEDILEGDDLIGIHATKPHKGERVIYSADKDLKTVPGLHWCPEDGEIIEVTEEQADRFFYEQILTGDPTDNYAGCPGVGPKGAAKLLDGRLKWVEKTRTLQRGPRKGQEVSEWEKHPLAADEGWWFSIVSAYEKVGLTERDALTQARCARILRHGEYNFKTQEVRLWTPN